MKKKDIVVNEDLKNNYRNGNYSIFALFSVFPEYVYIYLYTLATVFAQFSIRNLPMKSFPQHPIRQVSDKFQGMDFQDCRPTVSTLPLSKPQFCYFHILLFL